MSPGTLVGGSAFVAYGRDGMLSDDGWDTDIFVVVVCVLCIGPPRRSGPSFVSVHLALVRIPVLCVCVCVCVCVCLVLLGDIVVVFHLDTSNILRIQKPEPRHIICISACTCVHRYLAFFSSSPSSCSSI